MNGKLVFYETALKVGILIAIYSTDSEVKIQNGFYAASLQHHKKPCEGLKPSEGYCLKREVRGSV